MRSSLLSTVEIVFAIGMGAVGVLGLRTSFQLRNLPAQAEGDLRTPQEVAQSLFSDRVKHEVDPVRKPTAFLYLNRVLAGHEWIHTAENSPAPVPVEPGSKLFWSCRVSVNMMDKTDYTKDAVPLHPNPDNQRQIAILIYRQYKPDEPLQLITTSTELVVPETGKWDKKDEKKDTKSGGAP